jgi:hypothetical protein
MKRLHGSIQATIKNHLRKEVTLVFDLSNAIFIEVISKVSNSAGWKKEAEGSS